MTHSPLAGMEYKPQWMNMPNLSLRNQFVLLVLAVINILPHLVGHSSIIQEKAGEREDEHWPLYRKETGDPVPVIRS